MKKQKELTKQDYIMESLKLQLRTEEENLKRKLEVLKEYAFTDVAHLASSFNDAFHETLRNGYAQIDKAPITDKKKEELRGMLLFDFQRNSTMTQEEQILREGVSYTKSLVSWADYLLKGLSNDKKDEIIKACVTQHELWSGQFDRNSKIFKKIEEYSKK